MLSATYGASLARVQVPHVGRRVKDVLHDEYVTATRTTGPQPKEGQAGQANAVWTHRVTDADVHNIRSGMWWLGW